MDKLLCTLGMAIVFGFLKIRGWVYGLADMLHGTDGFVMVMTVCGACLLVAIAVWAIGSRNHLKKKA